MEGGEEGKEGGGSRGGEGEREKKGVEERKEETREMGARRGRGSHKQ